VGGNPGRFGTSIEDFHIAMARARDRSPSGLLSTATHDSKWGEDVRARLALVSELPEEWASAVRRWVTHNQRHRVGEWPDANAEYLLYQVLVGAFPLTPSRAVKFLAKATKEAKVQTSWLNPNEEYDRALEEFVRAVVADDEFGVDLGDFMATIIRPGWVSWLAQTLLRMTAPGIPDTYQGAELWDLDLVDPDNRHLVDFETRRALVADVETMTVDGARERVVEGAPKLLTLRRALQVRKQYPDSFDAASGYAPLMATGAKQRHVVGFTRRGPRSEAITLVPLHTLRLGGDWADTAVELPAGTWRNAMTGEDVAGGSRLVRDIFARWPVALLVRDAP
jgi:(1->4)-alpha-D-glucan 1-alpha-D-glucosylmutase